MSQGTSDPKQFSVTIEKLSNYVFKTFKNASDIVTIFNKLQNSSVERPERPVDFKGKEENHDMNVTIFSKDVKE